MLQITRRYAAIAMLAVLLPMAAPVAAAPAPAGDIARQTVTIGGPGSIELDDDFVVWSEEVEPSRFQRFANLYAAPLATRQPIALAQNLVFNHFIGALAPGFAIDGGVVAWVNQLDHDPRIGGIIAQDLRSGQRWTVTDQQAAFPLIAGAQVAWWERLGWGGGTNAGRPRLMLRDLASSAAPRQIAELDPLYDYLLRSPRMSERWVVWLQGSNDNGAEREPCWRLFAVPTAGGAVRQVDDLGCDQQPSARSVDLSGARVAYTDAGGALVIQNLDTGERVSSGPQGSQGQVWGGRYLFWSTRDGQPWGYDPDNDSAFPVAGQTAARIAGSATAVAWFTAGFGQDAVLRIRPLAGLLPAAPRPPTDPAAAGRGYFPETSHTLGGEFGSFWRRNGELPVFGYALTEELVQRMPGAAAGYTVQYLERQRFELHPENAGTPYQVLLGRLGAESLAGTGRDWQQFPKADPAAAHYFPQTGQAIAPEFWDYWRGHGLELGDAGVSEREALALWGYPISPPQQEALEGGVVRTVQWFERARFESHPENPPPFQVLLGRLAAEQVARFGWQ